MSNHRDINFGLELTKMETLL